MSDGWKKLTIYRDFFVNNHFTAHCEIIYSVVNFQFAVIVLQSVVIISQFAVIILQFFVIISQFDVIILQFFVIILQFDVIILQFAVIDLQKFSLLWIYLQQIILTGRNQKISLISFVFSYFISVPFFIELIKGWYLWRKWVLSKYHRFIWLFLQQRIRTQWQRLQEKSSFRTVSYHFSF